MSEHKDDEKKQSYSVDDILAEYGSGKYGKSKILEFPEQPRRPEPEPPEEPAAQAEDEGPDESRPLEPAAEAKPEEPKKPRPVRADKPSKQPKPEGPEDEDNIVEIEPESPFHGLAARFHTLLRRADHYADHMYDQAEPDEETAKAERYIPGVDREETPEDPAESKRPKRARPARPAPPDTTPADLAARCARGLGGMRVRLVLAMLCSIACAAVAIGLPWLSWEQWPQLSSWLMPGLLAVTGLLCGTLLLRAVGQLARLRLGAETLLLFAFLFTLADGAALALTDYRTGQPCCAVTAFGLAFALWGDYGRRRGDRLSCRAAAQAKEPYVVTLDEGKWSGRPAYAKWSGSQAGFGSQIQMEDGGQRAYAVAAPLLLLCCLVCAGLSAAAHKSAVQFLWTASATLTAASAWSALLVYGSPYHKLARRLFNVGAALAGWPGAARCREAGIVMQDNDLFPTGSVRVTGVRVFGDFPNEKAVAYAASLVRVLDCGLTRPFHDLLRAQGAFYREVSGVRYHEGGVTGIIRNQEVFVGTAAFMHLMDVPLPQGVNVKHAVFCAINGELAGLFALNYAMSPAVNPCLSALMRNGASPILATRDPNLIPALLGQKFKLPVDKMEFPPVDRRLELSGTEQDHNGTPVALLSREGLGPYCDAVVGGRRLRSAVRLGTALSIAGGALGAALTFYLTYVGAAASLTPVNFLLYMALWLIPTALLSHWVNQY